MHADRHRPTEPHAHHHCPNTTSDERWLAAAWPFVAAHLPRSPATVIEIGCGPLGGFVPKLRANGWEAVGVDPEAPEGAGFSRIGFEEYESSAKVDAVVASLSLHHVADVDDVLGRVATLLKPSGTLIVIEWAWELFDEATAAWCFDRLAPADEEPGWLHRRRDAWVDSGEPWDVYMRNWAVDDGIHAGEAVLGRLDATFRRTVLERGPYFFPDLEGVTEADEQAAIDDNLVQATRIRFVGSARQ